LHPDTFHVLEEVFLHIDKGLSNSFAPFDGLRPWDAAVFASVWQVIAAVEIDVIESLACGD
jgi:hypothetical protein